MRKLCAGYRADSDSEDRVQENSHAWPRPRESVGVKRSLGLVFLRPVIENSREERL